MSITPFGLYAMGIIDDETASGLLGESRRAYFERMLDAYRTQLSEDEKRELTEWKRTTCRAEERKRPATGQGGAGVLAHPRRILNLTDAWCLMGSALRRWLSLSGFIITTSPYKEF